MTPKRGLYKFLLEIVLIGLLTSVKGIALTRILTNNTFPPWDHPQLSLMIVNDFLIGAILHIFLEFAGLNEKFCKYSQY